MIVVYKIANPKGKLYIGQTKNFKNRMYNYKNPDSNSIGRKLYNSIMKYGWDSHKVEVLETLEDSANLQERLDTLEILYIDQYNTVKQGLNLTHGGGGGKPSQETINRRVKAMTAGVSQYDLEGNLVKEWSGLVEIEEALGYKVETVRANINGITNITKGHRWRYIGRESRDFKSKQRRVAQYDLDSNFIREWPSVKEAKEWLGRGDIYSCLEGRQKTSNNYIWKYVEV